MPSSTTVCLVALSLVLAGCEESQSDAGGSGATVTGATNAQQGATANQSGNGNTSATNAASNGPAAGSTSTGTPAGLVPIFVAQGHYGRTTISCDGGRTWKANQSNDDGIRCFENDVDCDHGPGAGRGLAYGHGKWVATFGWGAPGTVKTSTNGVAWQTVLTDTGTYADIAFGNDVFVANAGKPDISSDGASWSPATGDLGLEINTRAIGFSPAMGGRFVVTGESGENRDIVVSADDGQTWSHATNRPDDCVSYVRGLASSDDTIVAASGNGHVCTSTDGGDTWTLVDVGEGLTSAPIWTGTDFIVWNRDLAYTSSDGLTWQERAASPSGISIGAVARGDDGTFVASNDGWLAWYEDQKFYRSADGFAWEELDAGSFVGSHPINFIQFGYAEPSAECPLP